MVNAVIKLCVVIQLVLAVDLTYFRIKFYDAARLQQLLLLLLLVVDQARISQRRVKWG